jgi:peptidoglycan-N-acetylglucosamine deacetylase
MRLSRSKKVVLLGTALLTIGLAGRAAAETTPAKHPEAAAGSASAPVGKPVATSPSAARPSKSPAKPATSPAKPATSPPATVKPARPVHAAAKRPVGPAGSLMVTGSKAVALTFDDGPDPAQTPKILKLLAAQHVHATFCLVGENARKHPELVRQIVAGGHTLCDHTWNHSLKIGKKSPARIRADLKRTNDAIRKAAPGAKIKYFRAPGGNFTPALVKVAKQMGMTSIYWRVDPRDWDHPAGETHAAHRAKVIRSVRRHTHAGSIVLSHDYAQPDTIAAYRTLIPWLRHRYRLIALP